MHFLSTKKFKNFIEYGAGAAALFPDHDPFPGIQDEERGGRATNHLSQRQPRPILLAALS